jgi:hypothetical protein
MPQIPALLALAVLTQAPATSVENPVYRSITTDGLTVNGVTFKLPEPSLAERQTAEAETAALKTIAGDDRAVNELLRDSVSAPFILKTRDVKAGEATVRVIDLWFAVHARLEEIDPEQTLRQAGDQAVEAGNMRFESKLLPDNALQVKKLEPLEGRKEWFTHVKGRLLDRINVEATDRAVATRTADSLLIATRTDPSFDADTTFPNRWATLTHPGPVEITGPAKSYAGSEGYVKITRLALKADTLFVETHMAFVEPRDWFDGNPILRSKIGIIAQDQIRRLRREIQKKRSEPKKAN